MKTEYTFLFPSSEAFSSILVIGSFPNSTYDYYIAPRLGDAARKKLIYHNPHIENITKTAINPNQTLVIINRYITRTVVQWLEENQQLLTGIIWVVDDDFTAMISSFNVPFYNKIRPAQTLVHQKSLKKLVDHLIVSTNRLATHFHGWPVTVMPPVAHVAPDERIVDPRQLYYFAKMHKSEHAFLYPIVSSILKNHPDVHFTVTAKGRLAKKWLRLGSQVTVKSEISYLDYTHFLETLPTGGLFLVPLTKTKLNASRSDAKLIEIVKSGSAALIANERAYRRFLNEPETKAAKFTPLSGNIKDWIDAINVQLKNPDQANNNRMLIKNYLSKHYASRKMIVL